MKTSIGYMLGNFKGRIKSIVHIQYNIRSIDHAPIRTIALMPPPMQESFDDKGHVIESISYDKELHIMGRTEFVYNSSDLQTEQKCYDDAGQLKTRFVSIYNESGNLISTETYSGDGKLLHSIPWVSVENDDSEEMFDLENSIGSWSVREGNWQEIYDDQHHVIERYKAPDEITRMGTSKETYKYDSHGNITEQYTYYGPKFKLSKIEEWHYKYFDEIEIQIDDKNTLVDEELAF